MAAVSSSQDATTRAVTARPFRASRSLSYRPPPPPSSPGRVRLRTVLCLRRRQLPGPNLLRQLAPPRRHRARRQRLRAGDVVLGAVRARVQVVRAQVPQRELLKRLAALQTLNRVLRDAALPVGGCRRGRRLKPLASGRLAAARGLRRFEAAKHGVRALQAAVQRLGGDLAGGDLGDQADGGTGRGRRSICH